jgi:MoxR-like ATPase
MMTQSTRAINEGHSLHKQLEKLSSQPNDPLAASFEELDKKSSAVLTGSIEGAGTGPSLTSVNGSVTALYAELDRADAKPTSEQLAAIAKIDKDFSAIVKKWEELKSQDLAALNTRLNVAKRAEIHLDSHGQSDEGDGQDID